MKATEAPAAQRMTLSQARALLHDLVCQSSHCSGDNDHARRTQAHAARRILAGEDPAEVIHGVICHAAVDPTFGQCPDLAGHLDRIWCWLTQRGVADAPAATGGAA